MIEESKKRLFRVAGDVYSIVDISSEIGWDSVIELSIQRIIYLSSVFYSFKFPDNSNPFLKDYDFSVDLRGPFNSQIQKSILLLLKEQYLSYDKENNGWNVRRC